MWLWIVCVVGGCLLICAGCGDVDSVASTPKSSSQSKSQPLTSDATSGRDSGTTKDTSNSANNKNGSEISSHPDKDEERTGVRPNDQRDHTRILGDLLENPEDNPEMLDKVPFDSRGIRKVDPAKLTAAGIRVVESEHLNLYTDLPPSEAVDSLTTVFEAAIKPWCEYFQIDPAKTKNWKLNVYLMSRREPFEAVGFLDSTVPPFLHGYQRGYEIWLYDQDSDYYRRHLVLHEGTHGFMANFLGGTGPPWYSEGVAEYLGTHRWDGKSLALGVMPQDKEETPLWGRIKIVKDEYDANRGMVLTEIMKYSETAHRQNEPYGWCWAAAWFLDNNPNTQAAFRGRKKFVSDRSLEFSSGLYKELKDQWPEITEQWQLFVTGLDYGYDLKHAIVQRDAPTKDVVSGETVLLDTAVGWQSTGLRLKAGVTYKLSASGQFIVAKENTPWYSESSGVSLLYHQGQPIGKLMAAVRPAEQDEKSLSPLVSPLPIGALGSVTPAKDGVLYLRVNEFDGNLADNSGRLTVQIAPAP